MTGMNWEELIKAYAWAKEEQERFFPEPEHVRVTDLDRFAQKYYAHVSWFTDGRNAVQRVYWPAYRHQRGVAVARVKYSILDNYRELSAAHPELSDQMLRNGLWAWRSELSGEVMLREPAKRPETGEDGKIVAFPRALEGRPVEREVALEILPVRFSVCKVKDLSGFDPETPFCFIGTTDAEKSLVCPTDRVPGHVTARDDGWRAFRIRGQLDFSLIGILSGISSVLAAAKIGIFAVSTFDTDYILVKERDLEEAETELLLAGYPVRTAGREH